MGLQGAELTLAGQRREKGGHAGGCFRLRTLSPVHTERVQTGSRLRVPLVPETLRRGARNAFFLAGIVQPESSPVIAEVVKEGHLRDWPKVR